MIVSALLTSVGINLGLCILFFTLYSILRKQPNNVDVYVPRLLAEGKLKDKSHFNLERLLPSTGWLRKAWEPSEDELLSYSGLDAVVFMRILILSLKVFLFAGIIGIFILLPVNCLGNQLQDVDFADLYHNSLDSFSISNVNNGSKGLWVHFAAVYIFTGWICYLLYYEYDYISCKRIGCFYSSVPQPHQFTILVSSIPSAAGSCISDAVANFFREYYPSTYLSHVVVHRLHNLQGLISHAKQLSKRLARLQSEPNGNKFKRSGCFGFLGKKVNLVDHYGKKLENLEETVRLEQSEVYLAGEEVGAAFVSFKSRYAAAVACHLQQSTNPTQWLTEKAPEPHDVYWPFFSSTFMRRWISKLVVIVVSLLLTILFLLPVLIVQGLTNLAQLEVWFPFLKTFLTVAFVRQVVTGYLPSLILQLFLKLVPPVMEFLSSIQGYISHSKIGRSACYKVLWFTIWNIFFANVLSGSALNQVSVFLEPKDIPAKLAVAVPAQASFFIAYVVTSGWTTTLTELFRIMPLIWSYIRKPFSRNTDDDIEVPCFPYHSDIPRILFFGLLGITYFFLAPMILPFLLVYFGLGYIIYRNQFLNVYEPKYESGGKFWPIVHNSMIFSLILMHAIAVGIFTLKKLPLAPALMFPLPILTLLFNEYCRKRFLPNFTDFSVESLIKKDREEQRDASMNEFYDKLVTAYKHPALSPIESYSANNESQNIPLLSSSMV